MITAFQQTKEMLLDSFVLSRDAMHVHVGLVVFFALHMVLRRKLGDFMPLLLLLGVCLVGEVLDLAFIKREGHDPRWIESALDIWNTMFWPCLFTTYGRWGMKKPAGDSA